MRVEKVEGVLEVLSPIVSGSDNHRSNHMAIRRMVFAVGGTPQEIPVISGNSIRGQLRRLVMADMLEGVGRISPGLDLAEVEKLAKESKGFAKLWHALCSGGMLESVDAKDSGYLNLDVKREIRLALPPVSLLGTAIGNQMIQGKVDVAIARPLCKELRDSVPAEFQELCVQPFRELEGTGFGTRKDDIHEDREEDEAATQMLYTYDYIAPGTKLYHKFEMVNCNDIERSVLGRALELWSMRARCGGKLGSGCGEVRLRYVGIPDSRVWLNWLDLNKDHVLETLGKLEG